MEQAELRASLEEALGTPPWQEWERELAYFARHLRGWTNPRSKPDDRCAIKAELRELLDDKEAIHVLTEAERMLRHDALRKLVFDEEGSVQQAAIVPSELHRLDAFAPSTEPLQPLFELSGTETAQRLGYWWAKLQSEQGGETS